MTKEDITQVGLSAGAHTILKDLKEMGEIDELGDGYSLGVAFAIASQKIPPPLPTPRKNMLHFSTLGDLPGVVKALGVVPESETVNRYIERLADWGVRKIGEVYAAGHVDFTALYQQAGTELDAGSDLSE